MNADNDYALYIGVDPGETTGYCALLVDVTHRDPIGSAILVKTGTINGTAPRKNETLDESYARHFTDMRDRWTELRESARQPYPNDHILYPTYVVERPSDGMDKWKGKSGAGSRATKFTLGMRYGLVIASASASSACALHSYPVTSNRKSRGWYPTERTRNLVHAMSGQLVERLLRSRIAELRGATPDISQRITRDEVMSFGVLAFHIETGRHL